MGHPVEREVLPTDQGRVTSRFPFNPPAEPASQVVISRGLSSIKSSLLDHLAFSRGKVSPISGNHLQDEIRVFEASEQSIMCSILEAPGFVPLYGNKAPTHQPR